MRRYKLRLKVVKDDLIALSKNKFMMVTIIAIVLIPVIYGGLYLAAFWAPYDHTEKINVAVVNLDKGYLNDDDELKEYGKEVETNLKHNDDLGWYFESDYEEAIKGLENDKYFSLYVIPEDFSEKLEKLKKGELEKPVLKFIPNEKKNYINSLITKRGLDTLQTEINSKISSIFASTIIDELGVMKDGLNTASEGLFLLTEGTSELKNKIPVLQSGIEKVNEGTELLSDKLSDASNGVKKISDASETLNAKMPDLIDGVNELNEGSLLLTDKLADANGGVNSLKDAIDSYQSKLPGLQDATNDLYVSSSKLAESTESLKNKGGDLEDALEQLYDAMDDLDVGIGAASSSSLDIVSIANSVYNERKILADDANELIKDNLGLSSSLSLPSEAEINALIGALDKYGPDGLAESIKKDFSLFSEIGILVNETNVLLDSANSVKIDITDSNGKEKASEEISKILKIEVPTKLGLVGMKKGSLILGGAIGHFGDAASFFTSAGENDIVDQMEQVESDLTKMAATLPQTPDQLAAQQAFVGSELIKYGDVISKKLETQALFDANLALSNGLGDGADGTDKIKDGIEKVNESTEKFVSMLDLIYKNNNYLTSGLDMLNAKIPDLDQGIVIVNDSVSILDKGMTKLSNAGEKLSEGTDELSKKMPDLQEGTSMLVEGTNLASVGIAKIENASIKLVEGTEVLNEKMPDLLDGVNQLDDTTALLGVAIENGAHKLSEIVVMDSQNMGNFMAEPIKTDISELYDIENYGTGFTPYFVSLALWVGALALFIVVPIKNNSGVSSKQFAVSRYLMFAFIGTIQAILLTFVVMKLGLEPSSLMTFMIFNIFLSWTFIAIVQSLIYVFEDVGTFISAVWFVLQLTACGGTFSKELTPKFFQVISPYMPFTYSVSGTREIISGVNQSVLSHDVLMLFIFQIVALLLLVIGSKYKNYGEKIEENNEIKKIEKFNGGEAIV